MGNNIFGNWGALNKKLNELEGGGSGGGNLEVIYNVTLVRPVDGHLTHMWTDEELEALNTADLIVIITKTFSSGTAVSYLYNYIFGVHMYPITIALNCYHSRQNTYSCIDINADSLFFQLPFYSNGSNRIQISIRETAGSTRYFPETTLYFYKRR